MTIKELWLLVVHYWKLITIIPVACLAVCLIYLLVTSETAAYSATSRIVVNAQTAAVAGIASSEARMANDKDKDLTVTTKADTSTMTVSITVSGSDPNACATLANDIAEHTINAAQDFYEGSDYKTEFKAIVNLADPVEVSESSSIGSKAKYLLASFAGGLLAAICIVVCIDLKRRHVKTPEGVQEACELPVLEVLPVKDASRLLANVKFASKVDELRNVLVVPVGNNGSGEMTQNLLTAAAAEESAEIDVDCVQPLSESIRGAYDSREADAVIVVVRQWVDSIPRLQAAVAELRLADANVAGIVYARG